MTNTEFIDFLLGISIKYNLLSWGQAVIRKQNEMCDTQKHSMPGYGVALTQYDNDTDRTTLLCH
jgi:hypothetical protein